MKEYEKWFQYEKRRAFYNESNNENIVEHLQILILKEHKFGMCLWKGIYMEGVQVWKLPVNEAVIWKSVI